MRIKSILQLLAKIYIGYITILNRTIQTQSCEFTTNCTSAGELVGYYGGINLNISCASTIPVSFLNTPQCGSYNISSMEVNGIGTAANLSIALNDIISLQTNLSNLSIELTNQQNNNTALNAYITTLLMEISSLQTNLTIIDTELTNQQIKNKVLVENNTALINNNTALDENITICLTNISTLQTNLTNQQNNNTDLENTIVELKNLLSAELPLVNTTGSSLANTNLSVTNSIDQYISNSSQYISDSSALSSTEYQSMFQLAVLPLVIIASLLNSKLFKWRYLDKHGGVYNAKTENLVSSLQKTYSTVGGIVSPVACMVQMGMSSSNMSFVTFCSSLYLQIYAFYAVMILNELIKILIKELELCKRRPGKHAWSKQARKMLINYPMYVLDILIVSGASIGLKRASGNTEIFFQDQLISDALFFLFTYILVNSGWDIAGQVLFGKILPLVLAAPASNLVFYEKYYKTQLVTTAYLPDEKLAEQIKETIIRYIGLVLTKDDSTQDYNLERVSNGKEGIPFSIIHKKPIFQQPYSYIHTNNTQESGLKLYVPLKKDGVIGDLELYNTTKQLTLHIPNLTDIKKLIYHQEAKQLLVVDKKPIIKSSVIRILATELKRDQEKHDFKIENLCDFVDVPFHDALDPNYFRKLMRQFKQSDNLELYVSHEIPPEETSSLAAEQRKGFFTKAWESIKSCKESIKSSFTCPKKKQNPVFQPHSSSTHTISSFENMDNPASNQDQSGFFQITTLDNEPSSLTDQSITQEKDRPMPQAHLATEEKQKSELRDRYYGELKRSNVFFFKNKTREVPRTEQSVQTQMELR